MLHREMLRMPDRAQHAAPVVGVDLGATNMLLALVRGKRDVVHREHRLTERDRGEEHVINRLVEGIEAVASEAGIAVGDLGAVGVAVAGAVDVRSGVVLDAHNLGWSGTPLRARLEEALHLPVHIDNDVNAAAWGEFRLGAGRGCTDMFAVWIGSGIGGGLVIDSKLYHGGFSTAGEIGTGVVDPDGPHQRRMLEDFAGRVGMKRLFAARWNEFPNSMLREWTHDDPESLGTNHLKTAYEAGDAFACTIINRGAHLVGVALANLVTLLSLPVIVVGGGLTEAFGEPYLQRIRSSFDGAVYPDRCKACELRMTELRSDAGILGAARLGRDLLARSTGV